MADSGAEGAQYSAHLVTGFNPGSIGKLRLPLRLPQHAAARELQEIGFSECAGAKTKAAVMPMHGGLQRIDVR